MGDLRRGGGGGGSTHELVRDDHVFEGAVYMHLARCGLFMG